MIKTNVLLQVEMSDKAVSAMIDKSHHSPFKPKILK